MKITLTLELNRFTLSHLLAQGFLEPARLIAESRIPAALVADAIAGAIELAGHPENTRAGYFRELCKTAAVELHTQPPPPEIPESPLFVTHTTPHTGDDHGKCLKDLNPAHRPGDGDPGQAHPPAQERRAVRRPRRG